MPLVFIPSQLRELTSGAAQVRAEGGNVLEVISALDAQFPGLAERLCPDGKLAPGWQVSIDHTMTSRGLRATLEPDSELHFLPVIGGG